MFIYLNSLKLGSATTATGTRFQVQPQIQFSFQLKGEGASGPSGTTKLDKNRSKTETIK